MPERTPPSVIIELHSADRLARAAVEERLFARGVHPSFFALLVVLDLHAPVTPTQFAAETGLRLTTLRDIVNQMVEHGHVRRRPNPGDRRSHFLELTPKGRTFLRRAGAVLAEVEHEVESELGAPLEELRAPLTRLRRALRATYAAAEHE